MANSINIKEFANSKNVVIMAPAGCGKTHLIAEAVKLSEGKQLILTHTHAGVKSIISKLKKLSVPGSKYRVETIAGFALRYATSYPKLGGRALFNAQEMILYENLYPSAVSVLETYVAKKVIQSSFRGLYVDEYQDCTLPQHKLILKLSEYLQTHILGDPLQGIFEFSGDLVEWENDVFTNFELFGQLSHPWRWQNSNPSLGKWLLGLRELLENDQPIHLRNLPLNTVFVKKDRMSQIIQLKKAKEKCIGIIDLDNKAHHIAKSLQGTYNSMEEVERKTLSAFCRRFQTGNRKHQLIALFDVVFSSMTKVRTELNYIYNFLKKTTGLFKSSKHLDLLFLVEEYIKSGNPAHLSAILKYVENLDKKFIYRKELWSDLKKLIRNFELHPSNTLMSLLHRLTCQNSILGRTEYNKSLSRPFLIKGLEFDHAILLDANAFTKKQLYVALTRGSKSLTIISDTHALLPK